MESLIRIIRQSSMKKQQRDTFYPLVLGQIVFNCQAPLSAISLSLGLSLTKCRPSWGL